MASVSGRPWCCAMRSKARRMQVSMPSASTSTFRSPSASMSSLSHSMKVRSSIAALPTGTTSTSGPRVSTKPPTCWERWRGKPISSCVELQHGGEQRIARIEARLAHVLLRQRAAALGAPHHAGERRDRVLRQPHRLADVAHGRARAIGDDGGGDARRGRGRSGRRCTGSPPRAARARSRRRCRAARVRSGETKRSNSTSISVGFTAVMPRQ